LEQNAVEKQASPPNELKTLEGGLKVLWDRVKLAGEMISRLREERTLLQVQVRELEAKVSELERTLGSSRSTIKGLETQLADRAAAGDGILFNGEREALAARLKDLVARIETYL
jgi:hypothetical protein